MVGVLRKGVRINNQECVQRVAGAGCVNFRIKHRQRRLVKVGANACEQIRSVRLVDCYLKPFAERCNSGPYDSLIRRFDTGKQADMPGNFVGIGSQKIRFFQAVPKRFVVFEWNRPQLQQTNRFTAASSHFLYGLWRAATQRLAGTAKQVFQQLTLPVVPDFWTGSSNVSDSQQVQGGKPLFSFNRVCELVNDVRVADVLLLSNRRHGQVVLDQKDD